MEKVMVSAKALLQVLNALNGPGHYIRELQVTRGPLIGANNPINILCDEYNAAVDAYNESQKVSDDGTATEGHNAIGQGAGGGIIAGGSLSTDGLEVY